MLLLLIDVTASAVISITGMKNYRPIVALPESLLSIIDTFSTEVPVGTSTTATSSTNSYAPTVPRYVCISFNNIVDRALFDASPLMENLIFVS